jgi:gamma-glutamyltranspeptidase/glutathione hydrolase
MKKYFISVLMYAWLNSHASTLPGYAVASAHPLATTAGLKILAQGGNAFDAAVAVSAVLAVVEPYHSGLGGGGFWLLHQAKTGENVFVDAREVAPLAAHSDMFLDKEGQLIPGASLNGGMAAAIPGEPAALAYIASHYGRLPLAQSLAPAIALAEDGFSVDPQFYYFSTMIDRLPLLRQFSTTAQVYLKDNEPYPIGELLKQPDLAKTLKILAKKGHDGFYRGEVATKLVNGARATGGIWTLKDLADYKIKLRAPLVGSYHKMSVITAPPPSAGGTTLLTMLNILAQLPLSSYSKVQWVHYLVESMRFSYSQSNHTLADPDFTAIDLDTLLSEANVNQLRRRILPDKATPSTQLKDKDSESLKSKNTTHIAIIDSDGNRVSATMTINYIFGSSVIAAGTGVLLNDEMDDFSTKVGEKNVFGLVGNDLNKIEPGKRPLSYMAPTFLEMPKRIAILGTPGGSRIPTMVLLGSLLFNDHQGAISMVSGMRFHHQYLPDWLQFEPETFSKHLQKKLKLMGYHLMPLKQYYGDMQAITWDETLKLITAASDPRHIGLATAVITNNKDSYGVMH